MSDGFGNQIVGGQENLIRSGVRSPGFISGSTGWRIARDGSAEFNNATIRGTLAVGGTAPAAHEIIGGPIPAELTAYYTAGVAGITPTAPETVVALVEQIFDGHGNYVYRAVVVDSSATAVTSIVIGAVTAALVVTEAGRFIVNPGATLGGGRYENFTERAITILTDPASGTTVFATRHPTDAFDVFSLNVAGTLGWGDGTALTDTYLSRIGNGDLEIGDYLQIRGFGLLTDNLFGVLQNGDANLRMMIRASGQLRWSDGTAVSDTTLERASAGVLTVNGKSMLPNNKTTTIQPAGTQNIATTGFTSVTGVSVSITKIYAAAVSTLEIEIIGQGFVNVQPTNITIGVLINGADTVVDVFRYNAINQHQKFAGIAQVTGLAAGTYTVQARLHVDVGTTTFTTGASVAGWSINAREVAA